MARAHSSIPFIYKAASFWIPSLYQAESIGDFVKNKNELYCPWYTFFPIPLKITGFGLVVVNLNNVGYIDNCET